jgi:hypothetical protein
MSVSGKRSIASKHSAVPFASDSLHRYLGFGLAKSRICRHKRDILFLCLGFCRRSSSGMVRLVKGLLAILQIMPRYGGSTVIWEMLQTATSHYSYTLSSPDRPDRLDIKCRNAVSSVSRCRSMAGATGRRDDLLAITAQRARTC